ncbi:MAG TPA: transcriptional repressor, partial [Methylomirabilota bacterium]|nr:transcriptional repressor [Methylomirabilota bacterium]
MSSRLEIFRQWIKEQGLKATSQREDIAQVFFAANRHISVEELYNEVRQVNPRVGYATVYRTMKLLIECGLA